MQSHKTIIEFMLAVFILSFPLFFAFGGTSKPESMRVDAAMYANGKTYLFVKHAYYRLQGRTVEEGYPKPLNKWKGLPQSFLMGIDAAFYNPENDKIYLFKGSKYVRIKGTSVEENYPKSIKNAFEDLPESFHANLDSAIFHNGHVYFFKGKKYVRLTRNKMDKNYPAWQNSPNGWNLPSPFYGKVDASFYRGDNKRNYFFSGQKSLRLNGTKDDGGAKPISVWQGLIDEKRFVIRERKLDTNSTFKLFNVLFKDAWVKLDNYNGDHHISNASQLVFPGNLYQDKKPRTIKFSIPEYRKGAFIYYINDVNAARFSLQSAPYGVAFVIEFESDGSELPGRCFHDPVVCLAGNDATAPDVQWDRIKATVLMRPQVRNGRLYLVDPRVQLTGNMQVGRLCEGAQAFLCDGLFNYRKKITTALAETILSELKKPAIQGKLSDLIHERLLKYRKIDYVTKASIGKHEIRISYGAVE